MGYLQPTSEGVVLRIRLMPRSAKCGITGVVGECLKVRVNAPPVEGAANRACIAFLAKEFGLAKNRFQILSGEKSREKRILLKNVDEEMISSLISEALKTST